MAEAAAQGMDGDHIIEIARVANAVRDMTPERRAAYFEVFRNANVALGNDPKNIQKLTDTNIENIEKILSEKEKEILQI